MKVRWMRTAMLVLVTTAPLALAACGKKELPPPPPPQTDDGSAERARLEAEARAAAERARLEAEARAAEEAARAAAARKRATLEEMVFFAYDESTLSTEARASLDAKVRLLREEGALTLRIIGHADERGSTEYNLALGMRRASAIRDYLSGFGIVVGRLEIQSMGEERPLAQGQNEAAWSRNRRGEFVVTAGLPSR
jgi:peptidoglycan-associated lipoprotein